MSRERLTAVVAAVAVLVLGAVGAVAAHVPASPRAQLDPQANPTGGSAVPLTVERAHPPPQAVPWWLVVLGIAALVLVVGPLVWLALRYGRKRLRARAAKIEPEPREGDAVVLTERLPDADDALAEAAQSLDAGPADRAAVDELAALFHEARYSRHPVTDDQRARARRAVTALLGAHA